MNIFFDALVREKFLPPALCEGRVVHYAGLAHGPSGEATVNLSSQSTKIGRTGGYAGPSGFWSQNRNRHWVHTLSHRAVVTSITESTSVGGHPGWVRSDATPNFDRREVIRRARSRLGEDSYRLLTNNCEHFCEWCLRGERRSYQVEAWLAGPARALQAMIRLVAQVLGPLEQIRLRPARLVSTNPC